MAEYIERELLVKYLEELEEHSNPDMDSEPMAYGSRLGISYALSIARSLQASDVVEVVRCKDCKHQDDCAMQMVHTTRDYVLEQNVSTYNKVDFCSYGERKKQE